MLAFIYVPLNLATSAFGMNIQVLSGEGASLADFTYAATVIIIGTGACWFACVQYDGYHEWKTKIKTKRPMRQPSGYCLAARLVMLVWLLLEGHVAWLWTSKAWIGLLTDNRFGEFRPYPNDANWPHDSACEHVTHYFQNPHRWVSPGVYM